MTMSAAPDTPLPGPGRFRALRRVGAGGMGVVYEAWDEERGLRVALKSLPRAEPQALYLFKREFRALADVVHPNLVSLYELVAVEGRWFLTMEFIDGDNFIDHVRHGPSGAPAGARPTASAPDASPPPTDPLGLTATGSSADAGLSSPTRITICSGSGTPTTTDRAPAEPLTRPEQFARLRAGL